MPERWRGFIHGIRIGRGPECNLEAGAGGTEKVDQGADEQHDTRHLAPFFKGNHAERGPTLAICPVMAICPVKACQFLDYLKADSAADKDGAG